MTTTTGNERPTFGDRSLQFATAAVGLSGLFFVVFGSTTTALFKRLFYGTDINPIVGGEALGYTRFVYGVLGAVMFGWSLAVWGLVIGPVRRREPWAWNTVALSMAGWFIADSTLSIVNGYGENAILNAAFAVLFGVPLAGMRNELQPAKMGG
jgi:hypothetical protein